MKTKNTKLLLIIIVAIVLRLLAAYYLGNGFEEIRGGTHDQISYDQLAQRVLAGFGFSFGSEWWPFARAEQPTSFWSYLYTGYLAGVYLVFGRNPLIARVIQAILVGLFMPLLSYRIGAKIVNRRVGLLAAAIVAVYLYFVNYAASLMTEAFYITSILWVIDILLRFLQLPPVVNRRRIVSVGAELGIAMGIALLLRQVVLCYYVVVMAWVLWVSWQAQTWQRAVRMLAVAGFVVLMLLAPWMVRNYRAFKQISLPNTNVGFAFYWSNHPIYGSSFEPVLSSQGVAYQALIPEELRNLNEAALDRALLRRGLAFVRSDPLRYLQLSLSRIPVYFLFWPTSDSSLLSNAARLLSFTLFLPFMVYGLLLCLYQSLKEISELRHGHGYSTREAVTHLLIGSPWQYWVMLVLFIFVYSAVHLASWASVRYRLPVDAFLIFFAAYGLNDLFEVLRVRRIRHRPHVYVADTDGVREVV